MTVWLSLVLLTTLLLVGCKGGDDSADTTSWDVEKLFERGPVKVVMRLDNPEPSIADRITLELEATSDESHEVELPAFGEKLDQFGIVDFSSTQPELMEGGRIRQSRRYVLEPFLSGDYLIPAMTIRFRKAGAPADEWNEVLTEELKIVVSSLLPEEAEDLEIHEIAPPVELPKPGFDWRLPVVAGAVAGALAALVMVLFKKRKGVAAPPPRLAAHKIAFAQLKALVAEELPESGRIKEFYQRISDILRHYIENRFGLHAPERTTEEFLAELGAGKALGKNHRSLLAEFLQHCDLVKFAEHQPGTNAIQNTFDSCKNFILATQEADASPPDQP